MNFQIKNQQIAFFSHHESEIWMIHGIIAKFSKTLSMRKILYFCFIIIIFNSCSQNENQSKSESSSHIYDTLNLVYEDPKTDSNSYFKLNYSLLDIVGFDKTINDSLNNSLRNFIFEVEPQLSKPLQELALESKSNLLNEYKGQLKDFPDNYNGYDHDINQKLIFQNKQFISFEIIRYSFSAGAHGMGWTDFVHHDLMTGKRLYLNDFFKSTNKLVQLAEKDFRKQMELKENDDLEKYGFWFNNNKFHINENFCFRNDTVEVIFNQYEIAPFSMGQITLKVPLKQIEPELKSEMFANP